MSLVTGALAVALAAAPMVVLGPSEAAAAASQLAPAAAPAPTTADPSVLTFTAKAGSTSVTLSWCCSTTPARTYTVRRDDGTGTPTPDSGVLV
ncbi:hypothetical protein [Terrabacter sp. MAHUQ-38]|uniref:hypothetical protein n=1 Tax=unclassified Terrabacter TaxID=2630222 RepID=UPI00165E54E7|nr:hypothetical protein [Terrabacter sp. MAHUQ-38]MBC9820488.1 hypothetical protein [Terrabacter sp. MAHUQ-38]